MKKQPKKRRKIPGKWQNDPKRALQRLDRPPVRVYLPVDELGPNRGQARLRDAISDSEVERDLFGEARIYEYRLVDRRPRAVVPGPSPSEEQPK